MLNAMMYFETESIPPNLGIIFDAPSLCRQITGSNRLWSRPQSRQDYDVIWRHPVASATGWRSDDGIL